MNKTLTRKEKIRFLKGLLNRERNLSELFPEENFIIVSMPDEDGTIKHRCKGKELTEQEYQLLKKRFPDMVEIVVKYT